MRLNLMLRMLRSEDLLIGVMIAFALLYPFLVALVIWYEDYRQERQYEKALLPLAQVILGNVGCKAVYKEEILELLGERISPKEVERLCTNYGGSEIKKRDMKVDGDSLTYTVWFKKDSQEPLRSLTLRIETEDGVIKVRSVYLDGVRVLP